MINTSTIIVDYGSDYIMLSNKYSFWVALMGDFISPTGLPYTLKLHQDEENSALFVLDQTNQFLSVGSSATINHIYPSPEHIFEVLKEYGTLEKCLSDMERTCPVKFLSDRERVLYELICNYMKYEKTTKIQHSEQGRLLDSVGSDPSGDFNSVYADCSDICAVAMPADCRSVLADCSPAALDIGKLNQKTS